MDRKHRHESPDGREWSRRRSRSRSKERHYYEPRDHHHKHSSSRDRVDHRHCRHQLQRNRHSSSSLRSRDFDFGDQSREDEHFSSSRDFEFRHQSRDEDDERHYSSSRDHDFHRQSRDGSHTYFRHQSSREDEPHHSTSRDFDFGQSRDGDHRHSSSSRDLEFHQSRNDNGVDRRSKIFEKSPSSPSLDRRPPPFDQRPPPPPTFDKRPPLLDQRKPPPPDDDERKPPAPFEWGKPSAMKAEFPWKTENCDEKPPPPKDKPNFETTGKLAEDTNKFKGVVIKYNEPPEACKPKVRWRLYPFKDDQSLPTMYIHRQSAYLIGKDRNIVDLPVDHPSCSKQHAVLQYRLIPVKLADGRTVRRVKPYVIDLESTNGTFLNNKQIDAKKFYELFEKDVLKFGFSTREYVLLNEDSLKGEEEDVGGGGANDNGQTDQSDSPDEGAGVRKIKAEPDSDKEDS